MRSGAACLLASLQVLAGCVAGGRGPASKEADFAESFPCYPAQRVGTAFLPPDSCPGVRDIDEHAPPPDLVFRVSETGRVLDAYSVADVPADFESCLLVAGRSLEFEPARTCGGDAVPSVVRVAYRDVFPFPYLKADK
jgi:hypothetical protein